MSEGLQVKEVSFDLSFAFLGGVSTLFPMRCCFEEMGVDSDQMADMPALNPPLRIHFRRRRCLRRWGQQAGQEC